MKLILKSRIAVQRGLGVKMLKEFFEHVSCGHSWGAVVEVLWRPLWGSSVRGASHYR